MKKLLLNSLLVFTMLGIASVSNGQTVLLNENFSGGAMPAGWSEDSAGVTPFYTWSFNDPGARWGTELSGAGFDASFVIFDSDNYGTGNSQDAYLNLPAVNASGLTSLFLTLDEQYRDYTNGFHQIEVSVDGGSSWNHLITDTATTSLGWPAPAVHNTYDISSIAAGQANVLVRFHYGAATWAWWWALDNVQIVDSVFCLSPPIAGSASSVPFACPSSPFNLSLSGNSGGLGETYQWQSSPDGVSWTDISGATTVPYSVSQTVATYYHVVLTCGGLSSSSDSVFVNDVPTAGFIIGSAATICLGETDTLSLSTGTIPGVTYQWQSSPDDVVWTDIPGANSSIYAASPTVATWYRAYVSCGGSADTSASGLLPLNPNPYCYCFAQNPMCGGGDAITNVTIDALNNTSTCDMLFPSNFVFVPASTATASLNAGSSYNLDVTTNNNNIISVWFDFNHDLTLSASEWTQVSTSSTSGTANTVSIAIPGNAYNGLTLMRIRSRLSGNQNGAGDACLVMGSGETEDYEVTIANGINAVEENGLVNGSVFPTPTTGLLTINLGKISKSVSVVITDVMGKEVKSFVTYQNKVNVDLTSQSNGIYFVKLDDGNSPTVQKVILNK